MLECKPVLEVQLLILFFQMFFVEFVIIRGVAFIAHHYYNKYDTVGKERALIVEATMYKKMLYVDVDPHSLEDHYYVKWGCAI